VAQVPTLTAAMVTPASPGETPLTIGAVTFGSEECPSELKIGAGKQRTTVKEFDGGGRAVQSHGPQPDPVTWIGAFYVTANVDTKIKTLRSYMVSGTEVLVSYLSEKYFCKVTAFVPTYRHKARAGYDITIEITRDANGAFSTTAPVSLDAQVSALSTTATSSYNTLVSIDPDVTDTIDPSSLPMLQQSINNAGPLAAQGSNTASVLAAAQTALAQANTYAAALPEVDPRFFQATRLISALTLIERNVQQGQSPSSVRVQNQSLYEIASQTYGDVTKAFTLASILGVPTPRLPSTRVVTVLLPPLGSAK
jgi:hypothetical protein